MRHLARAAVGALAVLLCGTAAGVVRAQAPAAAPAPARAAAPALPVETMFAHAAAEETAVRKALALPSTTAAVLKAVRTAVADFEAVVRQYPASGYSDDALWRAARLSQDAFDRFHEARERTAAMRLLTLLSSEYPASRWARQAPAQLAVLRAASPGTTPADAPAHAPDEPLSPPAATAAGTTRVAAITPTATGPAEPTPGTRTTGATPSTPPRTASIRAIRRAVMNDIVRVVIELDAEVTFHDERLENPARVFVDLPNTRPDTAIQDQTLRFDADTDLVRQVRIGRHPNNTTRIVLEAAGVSSYSVYPLYSPYRLVIDLMRERTLRAEGPARPTTEVPTPAAAPPAPPAIAAATSAAGRIVAPAVPAAARTAPGGGDITPAGAAAVLPAPVSAPARAAAISAAAGDTPAATDAPLASSTPDAKKAPSDGRIEPAVLSIVPRDAPPALTEVAIRTAPEAAAAADTTRPSWARTSTSSPSATGTGPTDTSADGAEAASPAPAATRPPALPAARALPNVGGGLSMARQLGLGVSRIVIDPGHGGHDPGARGKGVTEAELVLDVALRLEKLLARLPGVEVVLTRRDDQFVALQERTAIANREGADLFLSIHANASSAASARGVETYFLDFASSQREAAVAARENATSQQNMAALQDVVKAIALNNKLDESRDFATYVQREMMSGLRGANKTIRDLGVKKAPFVVLIGASMPSILAEVSFLTNAQEARLLKSGSYRQRIAQALFEGVKKYQASLKNVGTIAQQQQQ